MRKVEIKGYIILDEEELNYGNNIVGQISDDLFNVEGVVKWDLEEVSNIEIEYDEED